MELNLHFRHEETKEIANDEKKSKIEKNEIIDQIFADLKNHIENDKETIALLNRYASNLKKNNEELFIFNHELQDQVNRLIQNNHDYIQITNPLLELSRNNQEISEKMKKCREEISRLNSENLRISEEEKIMENQFSLLEEEITFLQKNIDLAKTKNIKIKLKIDEILKQNEAQTHVIENCEKDITKNENEFQKIKEDVNSNQFLKENFWKLISCGITGIMGVSYLLNKGHVNITQVTFPAKNHPYFQKKDAKWLEILNLFMKK